MSITKGEARKRPSRQQEKQQKEYPMSDMQINEQKASDPVTLFVSPDGSVTDAAQADSVTLTLSAGQVVDLEGPTREAILQAVENATGQNSDVLAQVRQKLSD
jgi:hypothetical protein